MSESGREPIDAEGPAEPAGQRAPDPGGVVASRRFRLVRGGALILERDGFRLIEPRGLRRSPIHPYDAISHVHATDRVLLVGTAETLLTIRARDFVDVVEEGPEAAKDALLARVAAQPDGASRLAAIDAVDRLGAHDGPAWVVWTVVLLCLIGTGLQLAEPMIEQVGSFLPDLFARGEYWRAITAHFLHELSVPPLWLGLWPGGLPAPTHLAVNVAGLLILGHLVERPLGAWRTAMVLAMSGLGTTFGILAYGHLNVLGASGLVAGLAGAMLASELHHGDALPTYWRLPRRLFVGALVLQFFVVDQLWGHVLAGGAHLGGFVGGYLATWMLGRPSLDALGSTPPLRLGVGCALALLAIGVAGAWPLARHDMAALERHAARLYDTPDSFHLYRHDNAAAWLIATGEGASPLGLDLAVALADRAVSNTGRVLPGILDTLAEALFQRGDRLAAVLTIEEAIRLDPREPYYQEQRRRFTGDRDPDDRPPPPGEGSGREPWDPGPDRLPIDPHAPRVTT
jgi:membrane associated rhomboid family serine protease